jgi:hypothetical protein
MHTNKHACIHTQAYEGLGHEYGSEEMVDVQRFLTNRIPADPARAFAATLGLEGLIGRNDVKLGRTPAPKADCECNVCIDMYVYVYVLAVTVALGLEGLIGSTKG